MYHHVFYIVFYVVFVAIIGCSPSTRRNLPVEYVGGIVTKDGVPLENACIQFIPKTEEQGEAAVGYTDSNGKYTLTSMNGDLGKGALPGEYAVLVTKTISVLIQGAKQEEGEPPPEETKELVSALYNNRNQPLLEAVVIKGKNKFNFDVKSKP
ncbi:MAG: hypothetical protein LBQ50_05890 [Planctomycetaceae bacterium]|jgi:hypothetical protein|nr:hypothetical protein [Planctomycetaceae bacterium]